MKFYEMKNKNDAAAEVIRKIKVKEEFSEDELSELSWYFGEIDAIFGENRRWSRMVTTIIQLGDYFVALDWDEGLTEYQENEYYDQPYFVEPKEETIVVTRWERINND